MSDGFEIIKRFIHLQNKIFIQFNMKVYNNYIIFNEFIIFCITNCVNCVIDTTPRRRYIYYHL